MGLKDTLMKQMDHSFKTRDNNNMAFFYIKSNIPMFFLKMGNNYTIDVLLWRVGSGNNIPISKKDIYKPGEAAYVLDLYVHPKIPPTKASIVCPLVNYNLRCPICEKWEEYKASDMYNKDKDPYRPRRRVVYLVVVRSINYDKTEKEEIRIFENSHFYTERNWNTLAKNSKEGKGYQFYMDYSKEDGRSISFFVENAQNKEITGSQFLMRQNDISEKLQAQSQQIHLDDLVQLLSYEEIMSYLYPKTEILEDDIEVPEDSVSDDVPDFKNLEKTNNKEDSNSKDLLEETNKKDENIPECFGTDKHDTLSLCENCEYWKECFKGFQF